MKVKLSIFILITALITALIGCGKQTFPVRAAGQKLNAFDTSTFDYIFVEALKQKLMGNIGESLKLLEQASSINPSSDAVYYQMAQILLGTGDARNGKKYALKACSIDNKNIWYLMMLAGTYYQEKNLDSAIMYYELAINAFPEKEDLKVTLADLYSERGNFNKAAGIFRELDERYGVNEASTLGVVKNLMWAGKWDEALEKARLLIEIKPDEVLYNGLLAEIYRGKGEPGKAGEVYERLIERNPDNPQIQLAICDFLLEENMYDDLIGMLNTVIINEKIRKEDKISLLARLIENADLVKSYGNKIELSVMVLEASYPDDDLISYLRPELLEAEGKRLQAAERLEDILIKRPESIYAAEKLLLIYFELKDFDNLEKRGEVLSKKFNRSFLAKMLYATAAEENGKYNIAIEELNKAGILAGNNEEMLLQVLSLKADVYYRMKEFDKAFGTFDEAIRRNKNDLTILNNYAYFLAEQDLRLKEAEEMAKRVITEEKSNNTFLDTYAWVLFKRGKTRDAERIMKEIIDGGGADAEYYEHYGYILKKRKKYDDAIRYWKKALELDSDKHYLNSEIENCRK